MNVHYLPKSLLVAALLCCFSSFIFACGFAYVTNCSNMSTITVNGTEHIFQFDECPFGEVFADANLGSVTQLELTLIRQRTWESCDNNIMDATMYYRIYQGTTTTQPFIPYSLSMLVQNNVTDYREKIRTNPTPINVLQGLNPNTTYTIELYFTSNVDLDLDLQPDTALVLNNNGGSYKAIFTTDATFNNCSVLYAPAPTQIDVSCYGFSDGAAALSVCGGTEPYTYLWSNGATTQNISDVPAGIYSCIITDAVGATTTAVANIQQPSQLIVSLSNQMEINCFHSGAASIQIEGGVPPYAVFWSNGLSNTQTATFTTPGWYTYSVYDQHQCLSNLGTVIITSDTLVPILQATGGNVNCQNAPVTLQAITDGTNATFTWSGPNGFTSIQQNPTTTTCGEYSVTVTTPNGCSSTTAVSVSCEAISNIEINTQNISCDGILHVVATAVGGQPPYDYSWMGVTNIDGNNADVASGSTYGVSVTDMAGCFYQISPLTHSFVPLSATAVVTNESSPDAADGAVELFVTGGVAPYSFSGSALSNLPADEYAITITDAQGCAYIVNFIVGTTLGAEDVFNDNSITISPNPNTGEFILNTMLYQNNAVVNIFNTMGQLVFVKTLSNQNNPISISHLPKGVYWLVTNTEQKKKIIKKLLIQ